MTNRKLSKLSLALAIVLAALLLAACGDGDAGLSRAEVEEIVRSEMADAPAPEPGITSADVEEAIRRALADMPQPESGITSAEAESIARGVVASVPPRSAPAEYTRFFVDNAISMYETQGLDATLAHYNRPESTDGQWYVFIADENDTIVAHAADPDLMGKHASQALGPNSYPAGSALAASATESGAWFDYTYANPASGAVETKHSWVIIHDGLIFGSGWYEPGPSKSDAPSYTRAFVEQATNLYNALGLEETLAYHNRPESIDGQWYVFVIDENDLVSRPSRRQPPGAGREGLGGGRRQRLQLRAGDAVGHRGRQVGVIRVPESGERWSWHRFRPPGAQERLGGAARRPAVRLRLVHQRRRVHQVPGSHSRPRVP